MSYLLPGDIDSHLYDEIKNEIVRDDNDIIVRAIDEAVTEAKGYLSRFDLVKLFGFGDDSDATVIDENLKSKVKDIACWRLIRLANPNINVAMFRTNYEDAIKWFQGVMKGQIDPEGWVYKTNDITTPFPEGNAVTYSSNKKRFNSF